MAQEIDRIDITQLEAVQNRLASALIQTASAGGLVAKDWVQGGWSRGSKELLDKLDFGLQKEAITPR